MERIADWIMTVLQNIDNSELHKQIAAEVRELCAAFPVPGHARYAEDAAHPDIASGTVGHTGSAGVPSPS